MIYGVGPTSYRVENVGFSACRGGGFRVSGLGPKSSGLRFKVWICGVSLWRH